MLPLIEDLQYLSGAIMPGKENLEFRLNRLNQSILKIGIPGTFIA
jgi:hypothetical protein